MISGPVWLTLAKCRRWLLAPRLNKILEIHIKRIRDTIDVVEVPDHLGRVVNSDIVEAGATEFDYVLLRHGLWRSCQLFSKRTQGLVWFAKRCRAPIFGKRVDLLVDRFVRLKQSFCGDFGTEVMSVGPSSIGAVILL